MSNPAHSQQAQTTAATSGTVPRVAFVTLGCKVNFFDTAAMTQAVARHYAPVEEMNADALVINTCTVTHAAWQDARKIVRRFKRANPQGKVVLTGCHAQIAPHEAAALSEVDWVLGTRDRQRLGEVLDTLFSHPAPTGQRAAVVQVSDVLATREAEPLAAPRTPGRTRGFLRVQTGCNYRCSFCVIPLARGNSVSLPFAEVLAQAGEMIAAGHGEIVPTGIHVADYGKDLRPRRSLQELLHALLELPGLKRLRLSSLDPHEVDEDLIALVCRHPLMARHLHVAVQSASDPVLKAMKRRHNAGAFVDIAREVARQNPFTGVGTDLIAAFPTETEEDHETTLGLLRRLPLSYAHVFPYSHRPGTAASALRALPPVVMRQRAAALREAGEEKRQTFAASLVGRRVEVLVEGQSDAATGRATGWTSEYVRALLPAGVVPPPGNLLTALATQIQGATLYVTPVD